MIWKIVLITLGSLILLVVGAVTWNFWSSSKVRVHSAEQAVAMARTAYGPKSNSLPVRVETDQDFWIVRLGPDSGGATHSYLVALWDKRAHPLVAEETVTVAIRKPN